MEPGITKMTPQTQERMCSSCGKQGHMVLNCKRGEKSWYTESPEEPDTAGRGGYNATPQHGPLSADDWEEVRRKLEVICSLEDSEDDTSSDSGDSEVSSICSEISWERYITTKILAGDETAQSFFEDATNIYEDNVTRTQERFRNAMSSSQQAVACRTMELGHFQDYSLRLFHLVEAVKKQVSKAENESALGIRRGELYQDRLARNIYDLPRLQDLYTMVKDLADIMKDEVRCLDDVARTSQSHHIDLSCTWCYTDDRNAQRPFKAISGYPLRQRQYTGNRNWVMRLFGRG
jgi:hypothetical protein